MTHNQSYEKNMEQVFNNVCDKVLSDLRNDEHLTISMKGERSHFIRLSKARVRQAGIVCDADVGLNFIENGRSAWGGVTFSGNKEVDTQRVISELERLRREVSQLPEDPYVIIPKKGDSSREVYKGNLLSEADVVDALLPAIHGVDLAGIYASGVIFQGTANSAGQRHWFSTETFSFDYSLITPEEKMVKSTFAGTSWDQSRYEKKIKQSKREIKIMEQPVKKVKPGTYRTCFGPAAVADLIWMFSWEGLGEGDIQQGKSALIKMREEGKTLSPLLTLSEDFRDGTVPKFNEYGELSSDYIPLILKGKLVNTLISSRTAKEYQMKSNYAPEEEYQRSPRMANGTLDKDDLLKELGTGLYLSNLHYLNWSDNIGGRVTGMTRYACFWVENGNIVSPINNMRFDDTIYNFFGNQLEEVSSNVELIPDVSTYEGRQFGGAYVPAILVSSFTLTL
ncbi:MAG: TldD/PmbA family protein [Candidatus Marinimicrobia bacterium]|nr:TldD/PmbA family protein [Candidatus Neomarinimicrobiota bacterium]